MSRHDENRPRTTGAGDGAERRDAGDAGRTGSAGTNDRVERSRPGGAAGDAGIKHDPALKNVERLQRLGNEEEKPADDRYGD